VTSELLLSWSNTYAMAGTHNTFAGATLDNATHKLNTVGCWGINGATMPMVGTGILNIPSSFLSNVPSGARYGVGFGVPISSYPDGVLLGPSLMAVVPPAPNQCAPNTDYLTNGTVLSRYVQNSNGPNCIGFRTSFEEGGSGTGCTPNTPPTAPYPAKMAFNNYSKDMYGPDWNPYNGGNGWFGFDTLFSIGWYDDGVKNGIVVPIAAPEGWANTTILASPAPTINTSDVYNQTGTMTVASTSTHDGLNMNPGDRIWIQTCTPGVDPGMCDTVNGHNFSSAIIDSVNVATGQVAFHIYIGTDFGSGNHKPVVGGAVYLGCVYMHGYPGCSRGTYRLQIYDPALYAQVAAGTRQPYDISYNQEMDLNPFVPGLGSPESGRGGADPQVAGFPISTITDTGARQIIIAFANENPPPYHGGNAIYVFNVGPNAVTPPIAPQSTPSHDPTPAPSPATTPATPSTGAPCTLVTSGTDALGHIWTISFGWTMRDGQYSLPGGGNMPGAAGSVYKFIDGIVNVKDSRDGLWYRWNESVRNWIIVGAIEPACSTNPTKIGDLNNDGIVNSFDWAYMNSKWYTNDSVADINKDGIVNTIDFSMMNQNWLK
jgi:hypothetical protein